MSKETLLVYLTASYGFVVGVRYLIYAISASSRRGASEALQSTRDRRDRNRIERADDNRERVSPLARYLVSGVGFVLMAAVLAHLIAPAVAYAFLCLSMAARSLADQIVEEQAPRRRSTVIGRSRSIDPVLAIWIALTGVSTLFLTPWLLSSAYQVAATIVVLCVLTVIVVAWRIASAPPLLFGKDLEAEEVVDRETRVLRTGNACFLTVIAVMLFIAFMGGQQGFIDHRFEVWTLEALWIVLFAWARLYARHLARTPLTS